MRQTAALLGFAVALVALGAGCDQLASPIRAAPGTSTGAAALRIIPESVQLAVGTTAQLTTNSQAAVQWSSLAPQIAAVSPAGVVTALAPGTAVIQARSASDTTQTASAVVTVVGPAGARGAAVGTTS